MGHVSHWQGCLESAVTDKVRVNEKSRKASGEYVTLSILTPLAQSVMTLTLEYSIEQLGSDHASSWSNLLAI
jgi:hypothetical protein